MTSTRRQVVSDHLAALHHKPNPLQLAEIVDRISRSRDEISELSGLNGAHAILPAQQTESVVDMNKTRLSKAEARILEQYWKLGTRDWAARYRGLNNTRLSTHPQCFSPSPSASQYLTSPVPQWICGGCSSAIVDASICASDAG
jgi:hypothetical protein